jgi:hypothetical protein
LRRDCRLTAARSQSDRWRFAPQAASLRSQACVFECAPTLAPVALFLSLCRRFAPGSFLKPPRFARSADSMLFFSSPQLGPLSGGITHVGESIIFSCGCDDLSRAGKTVANGNR